MTYRAILPVLALAALAGCNLDPEVRKHRFLEIGNKYMETGQYDEASILYRKAIQQDGRFGPAYCALAEASQKLGRYGDVTAAYRRCFELEPTNLKAFASVAEIELLVASRPSGSPGTTEELARLVEIAGKNNPGAVEVVRIKGLLARVQGQLSTAIELFEQAIQRAPGDPKIAVPLVESLNASGRFEEAERYARQAIDHDPSFATMYDLLYLIYYKANRPADAEAILVEKADKNPKSANFIIDLAAHYHRHGSREKMDEALQKRMLDHPENFPRGLEEAGDFFVRLGEGVRGATYYEAARAKSNNRQNDLELIRKTIAALFSAGQWDQASTLVDKATEIDPANPSIKSFRAVLRLRTGNQAEIASAVRDLEQVVTQAPNNAVMRYRLGEAQLVAGNYRGAMLQFDEALKLQPAYPHPKYGQMRVHLARNELAQVTRLADEILGRFPDDPRALLARGIAALGLNRYDQARQDLENLTAQNQFTDEAMFHLARLETATSRFAEAEKRLQGLERRRPGDDRVQLGLANLYFAEGRGQEARKVLAARVENAPERWDYRYDLARFSARLGEVDTAIEQLRHITGKAPDFRAAQTMLGELLLRKGDLAGAKKHFQMAAKGDRPSVEALVHLGTVLAGETQYAEARQNFEKALALNPGNLTASNNLAYVLAETNTDLDLALTHAQRATAAEPDNPAFADTLGLVYIKRDLPDRAIAVLGKIVAENPDQVPFRYHYATALFRAGMRDQARSELQTALRHKPTVKQQGEIREMLQRIGL